MTTIPERPLPQQPPMPPMPPQPRKRTGLVAILWIASVAVAIFIGVGIGAAAKSTPAGSNTSASGGSTQTVNVPGPTVTVTAQAAANAIPAGQTIGTWSGTGNQHTPFFNIPASGDYIIYWTYSNNQGSNFAILDTNQSVQAGSTPNDIASSGSGSTENTGGSGVDSFNVTATGNWTIKVVAAP